LKFDPKCVLTDTPRFGLADLVVLRRGGHDGIPAFDSAVELDGVLVGVVGLPGFAGVGRVVWLDGVLVHSGIGGVDPYRTVLFQ
jgi:hypothetical protein